MEEYVVDVAVGIGEYVKVKEEIVRCRDCEHLNIVGKCPCVAFAMENLDGFCAWGERTKS